jgi:hypothetical protein
MAEIPAKLGTLFEKKKALPFPFGSIMKSKYSRRTPKTFLSGVTE